MRSLPFPRTPAHAVVAALLLAVMAATGCEQSAPPETTIESTAPASPEDVQKLVGPGCPAYTKKHATGPGSVGELADKPVAEAIQDHPMLTRFAAAIGGELNARVNLVAELDGGEYTVFVPTDAAFRAKVPKDWSRTLAEPSSAKALRDLLLFHVVTGQRDPGDLRGEIESKAGPKLEISTDGDRIRIADQANVTCGGLRTANATIYLVDSVLMPPATP